MNRPIPFDSRRRYRRRKRHPVLFLILALCPIFLWGRRREEPADLEPLSSLEQEAPRMTEEEQKEEEEDWRLLLVNPWNPVPEGYEPALVQLSGGHAVEERCYPDLQEMMDDCRKEGLLPLICSSYRTQEKQEQLYEKEKRKWVQKGYSEEEAEREAGKSVALPGTSEHQLGLAVDIVDSNYQLLDVTQEETPVQKWLVENCWKYGFILRYPPEKSDRTGIIYEPWHYRYVGKEAAAEMRERGLCLEEYLEERRETAGTLRKAE